MLLVLLKPNDGGETIVGVHVTKLQDLRQIIRLDLGKEAEAVVEAGIAATKRQTAVRGISIMNSHASGQARGLSVKRAGTQALGTKAHAPQLDALCAERQVAV